MFGRNVKMTDTGSCGHTIHTLDLKPSVIPITLCGISFAIAEMSDEPVDCTKCLSLEVNVLKARLQIMFDKDHGLDRPGTAFMWISLMGIDGRTSYGSYKRITQKCLEGRKYEIQNVDGGVGIMILDSVFNPKFSGDKGWNKPLECPRGTW